MRRPEAIVETARRAATKATAFAATAVGDGPDAIAAAQSAETASMRAVVAGVNVATPFYSLETDAAAAGRAAGRADDRSAASRGELPRTCSGMKARIWRLRRRSVMTLEVIQEIERLRNLAARVR